jgi:hypothetical protein
MWLWRRRWREPVNHTDRLPDGDTVVPRGRRRSAELLTRRPERERWADLTRPAGAEAALDGPTGLLPLISSPLMTPAQRRRGNGAGS